MTLRHMTQLAAEDRLGMLAPERVGSCPVTYAASQAQVWGPQQEPEPQPQPPLQVIPPRLGPLQVFSDLHAERGSPAGPPSGLQRPPGARQH